MTARQRREQEERRAAQARAERFGPFALAALLRGWARRERARKAALPKRQAA